MVVKAGPAEHTANNISGVDEDYRIAPVREEFEDGLTFLRLVGVHDGRAHKQTVIASTPSSFLW
jgi:hypothetical protein